MVLLIGVSPDSDLVLINDKVYNYSTAPGAVSSVWVSPSNDLFKIDRNGIVGIDADHDGRADYWDYDTDGVVSKTDLCPSTPIYQVADDLGCSWGQQDGDEDGIRNDMDDFPEDACAFIDTDGDGKADQVSTFAKMDHPRGLIYDNGKLWVLHPPFLTLYEDTNKDGVADKQKRLIEGISTDYVSKRGADHTTNGIRMGIDGWIYIAVGDFGFTKAVGADGRVLSRRGGGIVRVRPDGTDMEIYCWGLRNILDACIDPYLNIFTRDNTNDGGGWNVRFSHIMQSAEYGYPSWYKNFHEEIFPALKDYGGGSGCGGMFYHDTRWPKPYSHGAYTCDWGLSAVFLHNPPANGPTFDAHQETFLTISRPTDIDVDASGRMYVASWHGGKFAYGGPNVGFVVQVIPEGFKPQPFPDTTKIDDMTLFELLIGPSQQQNLHAQFELLRRGPSAARTAKLNALATSKAVPLVGRVAAIFTLKQLNGVKAQADLLKLAADHEVGEFALRALTDRTGELKGLTKDIFVNALDSTNARVRTQALISLGRLNDASAAAAMLPHATAPQLSKTPAQNEPNPEGVIPHIATRALVALKPVDTLLNALNGSHSATALSVLKYIHDDKVVAALTARAAENPDPATLTTLVRLFHREGNYTEGWWGTRPDTTGPYFAREKWSASDQIETALKIGMANASSNTVAIIKKQLIKHKVSISGLHLHEKMAKKMPLNTVSGSASEKFRKLEIQCVDGIKFNIEKFTAKTGENLALVLVNKTNMPHNLVITEPGAYEKVGAASISMLSDPKAADNHYVPNLSSIITSTYVVQPQGSHTLYFTVPKTPGDYPFLCTFPGHWQLMKGVMEVKK